jgi:His-Xaa-Ser system protein HxsD
MGVDHADAQLNWIERRDDYLALAVDTTLYPDEAVFRACYAFTDRCYLFLHRDSGNRLVVQFRQRRQSTNLDTVVYEFGNELINQRIRYRLAHDTKRIRELIVEQAFAEARFENGK